MGELLGGEGASVSFFMNGRVERCGGSLSCSHLMGHGEGGGVAVGCRVAIALKLSFVYFSTNMHAPSLVPSFQRLNWCQCYYISSFWISSLGNLFCIFFFKILENEVDFTLYVLVINGLPLIN